MAIGICKVERLLRRLAECAEPPAPNVCMSTFCGKPDGSGTKCVPLVADQRDVHLNCGGVDAQQYVSSDMRRYLDSPEALFPDLVKTLADFADVATSSRKQYLLLMARELEARKSGSP